MKAFQQIQLNFIAHIKDPSQHPFDGEIEDERLKIYRELFFNNVCGFLSSGFPVLESLYSETDWLAIARQFFAKHDCPSPYFLDISKSFVAFLSTEYEMADTDPVFMQELAHYEWLELDVSVRKSEQALLPWNSNLEVNAVCMSKLASLVSYQFPVHQISQDFQPLESEGEIYLVVYRDDADEVNFTLVNQVTAYLLNIIQQESAVSVQSIKQSMAEAMPQIPTEQLQKSVQQVIAQLLQQQILLPITS